MQSIYIPEEPKIVCPEDPDYELPISIVDPRGITENDEELIQAMAQHSPKTRFKAGDLGYLREVPFNLRTRNAVIPRIWKVRFVITAWAYELLATAMNHGGNIGMDRALSLLEHINFNPMHTKKPMIYAHGYPHGVHPATAAWIPERALRRLVFREQNMPWYGVLEEAGANFYGYDTDKIPTSFHFSLAPDDYRSGSNIGKPFHHEEDVTHLLASNGLEEHMFVPIILGEKKRPTLDPDHDVFGT